MAWTADLKTSHGKPTPQCQEMSYSADSKMENEDSQRPCEKPFTKALGTVSPWGVDKIFGGRYDGHQTAGWFINPGNYTPVPSHLLPSLDSCDFTNNWPGGGSKTGLVETRVRMILCAILADRKRHGHVQNYRGTRILPSSAYESLQFQANKSVQLSWTYKNKSVLFIDTLSYCLQTAVDPNTVFVIDIRRRDRHDYDYMIACMYMIHHARKEARLPSRTIYGIMTDSYDWYFIRVNTNCTHSFTFLSTLHQTWSHIISITACMIDHAAGYESGLTTGPSSLTMF